MVNNLTCLIKPASGACNLGCQYCFYTDEMTLRTTAVFSSMSDKTSDQLIDQVMQFATQQITFAFQGGEPLLAGLAYFQHFINQVKKKKGTRQIQYTIQTNATLLSEAWTDFFKQQHFLVGISLDGTQEIHDTFRLDQAKKPTFDQVIKGIALCQQAEVEFNILTVLTHQSARAIDSILDFYEQQNWHYHQFIPCLDPLYQPRGQQVYSLSSDDYTYYLIHAFERWYQQALTGHPPYNRQFENILRIILGMMPEACGMFGQCMNQYVIEADGSVYPCDFYVLDEFKLGNITTQSFEQINQKRKEIGFIEQSMQIDPTCRQCRYNALCRGGCRRDRQLSDSQIGLNAYCKSYLAFYDACLAKFVNLAKKLSH